MYAGKFSLLMSNLRNTYAEQAQSAPTHETRQTKHRYSLTKVGKFLAAGLKLPTRKPKATSARAKSRGRPGPTTQLAIKEAFKNDLRFFYRTHNPAKGTEEHVEFIASKYAGRVRECLHALNQKYAAFADGPVPAPDGGPVPVHNPEHTDKVSRALWGGACVDTRGKISSWMKSSLLKDDVV